MEYLCLDCWLCGRHGSWKRNAMWSWVARRTFYFWICWKDLTFSMCEHGQASEQPSVLVLVRSRCWLLEAVRVEAQLSDRTSWLRPSTGSFWAFSDGHPQLTLSWQRNCQRHTGRRRAKWMVLGQYSQLHSQYWLWFPMISIRKGLVMWVSG